MDGSAGCSVAPLVKQYVALNGPHISFLLRAKQMSSTACDSRGRESETYAMHKHQIAIATTMVIDLKSIHPCVGVEIYLRSIDDAPINELIAERKYSASSLRDQPKFPLRSHKFHLTCRYKVVSN